MIVAEVAAGSEAERAGLQVDDTVLEINGKVRGRTPRRKSSSLNPGDTIAVKMRGRRGGDREVKWKVGSRNRSFLSAERHGECYPGTAGTPGGVAERRGADSMKRTVG